MMGTRNFIESLSIVLSGHNLFPRFYGVIRWLLSISRYCRQFIYLPAGLLCCALRRRFIRRLPSSIILKKEIWAAFTECRDFPLPRIYHMV